MHKFILMLLFGLTIVSCGTDTDAGEFVVGSDYLAVNNKIILIDTVTVEMSTINFDSLVTSGQNRILVGNYDDPLFGKVKSSSYFQLHSATTYALTTNGSDTDAPNFVFDSISMILKYDRYYYGDTTKVQTFDIHRLTQRVKPNTDDSSFYNNSTLTYSPESIGSISYRPRPLEKDSITIKMDGVFGDALFQKIKKREITDFDNFTEYLKGLVIVPATSNSSSVIGFDLTTSVVRMYYSKYQGDEEKSYYIDFTITDSSVQFNSISSDKTGTLLENLPNSSSKLSSTLTNQQSFIQSGTGVACRIDFPNIKQLKYISDKGAIVDAQLILKAVNNSYSVQYPLADSVQVHVGDNLNRISGTLLNSAGAAVYGVLNKKSDEFNENVAYSFSIGTFLQKEMLKQSDSKSSLVLTLPGISNSVDRIVLGDQKHLNNKIQLKIYYISY